MIAPLTTERLRLRCLDEGDAAFTLQLLNDPGWLQHIGDRGVRTLDDAARFLREGHWTRYVAWGFGFFGIERRAQPGLIGVCGLAQREHLDAPDLGYALLSAHAGQGYALEAARAVVGFAAGLPLPRLLATVRVDNLASQRLLARLGGTVVSELQSPESGRRLRLYQLRP